MVPVLMYSIISVVVVRQVYLWAHEVSQQNILRKVNKKTKLK